ncbi:hypothetical protein [Deminuibacter soli]|uniref:Uncharacterized protein n=1 Tax=Deminuibacter soli TaxID=2291815 RepID=A0A3E1NMA4_9BACT|nr:hypothetical protein [Deminuibacter soli]RFM29065.1 hypothetical protein DXN05_09920 [Deminuibacter soli]
MKTILISFWLLSAVLAIAQNKNTAMHLGERMPLEKGYVIYREEKETSHYVNPNEGVDILSDNILDSVFSVSNGSIYSI